MSERTDLARAIVAIKHEFPDFVIIPKSESRLMKACDLCLKIITLCLMRQFMHTFVTTVGETVYVPNRWQNWPETAKAAVLFHERIHMRQKKKYGFWFYILFLFVPVPILFAYYRKKFEQEAYEETLRVYVYQHGKRVLDDWKLRTSIIVHFTTAEYFWMWPWSGSLNDWYDEVSERLRAED